MRRAALQLALSAPHSATRSVQAQAPTRRELGQLSLPARLSFQLPADLNLARLDTWLCDTLGLDRPNSPGTNTDADDPARAWLQRALLLTRLLLQALRVPVFDTPQILSCRPSPAGGDCWQAQVTFARIDEMPTATYQVAFNGALQLNTWALARPVDDTRLQAFYALAESLVLARLRPTLPFGKSSLPLLRVAHARSIPFMHLGYGVFQLGWGARAQRMDRSATGRDPIVGARLCADKAATAALLRKAGLPAPVHKVVTTRQAAQRAARSLGWPVVVKPADCERGEGVTVDVDGESSLQAAFDAAQAPSRGRSVIVERQVDGVCHRLFITRGRLLYAVRRGPMRVDGDGVSSIAGLVDAEVARQRRLPPWERSGIEPLDDLARATLARAGWAPASVPARGERVPLRRIESTAWGGVDDEVTLQIHPENLRVALAAAELFGLDIAGIDIISADIGRPWFDNGAIVNEVNFAPLLGGAPISRSHIPAFLDGFIDGNGTIPVDAFVGGDAAWAAATRHGQTLQAQGLHVCLTSAAQTLAPDGSPWPMPLEGLHRRTRALLLSARVHALVLVVQTDEFLDTGLPMEAVSRVSVVDQRLTSVASPDAAMPAARVQALLDLLAGWTRLAKVADPAARG